MVHDKLFVENPGLARPCKAGCGCIECVFGTIFSARGINFEMTSYCLTKLHSDSIRKKMTIPYYKIACPFCISHDLQYLCI